MDLLKLRTVQWITILGSIGTVVSLLALWDSPYRVLCTVAALILPLATGLIELQKDRINVFFAGIRKYHPTFPVEDNTDMFQSIEKEYSYLGVSFGSVLNSFRSWYGSSDRRANISIRLLLVDPGANDVLEFQARYEKNLWGENLSEAQKRMIDDIVQRAKDSTKLVLDTLATLPAADPPIEVYFHRERIRKWMHIVNGNTIYVGMLPMGNDGLRAPAMELKREPGKWRLFDYHRDEWDSILKTARRIQIPRPS